jgi:SAM-dependent methyltransferase
VVAADAGPPSPSTWIARFADLVPAGGSVVDLACGGGRHTRLFLERGHPVLAVDRSLAGLGALATHPRVERLEVDLEDGRPLPVAPASCGGVVVTNYLHRPLLPAIVDAVAPGGVLLYETFAVGNERFGSPSNPDFLLRPGELLDAVAGRLRVVAYEDLAVDEPRPAAIQRISAVREA